MPLTSKERVNMALNFEEPDRVPIFIGISNALGVQMNPYRNLKEMLGIQAEDQPLYDWPELGTAKVDEETLQRLHCDARGVWDREPAHIMERNKNRAAGADYIDSWGSGARLVGDGDWFPMVHPLADATDIEDLENYPWPDMNDPTRVAHVREHAQQLADENEYAIIATPWLLFPFERAFAMQGMAKVMQNLAMHPDFAVELFRKNAEMCKTLMGHFLDALGENVDIIKIGDDLGTQESLMISPKMYRNILKPIHADYIDFIKNRTKAKVMFHTDGNVFPLIPDFIEIGVDILNPIQTSAGKMSDLAALKKRYGQELVFCGGIDTHHILPYGTPEEVQAEVKRVIELLAPGGGYIAASVHTIINEVPPENILAFVDAVAEFGKYPIS